VTAIIIYTMQESKKNIKNLEKKNFVCLYY